MARSRSGTRGRRGPRKPPRRDGAFNGGNVQVLDPRERGAIELPGTITVKELAELLAVNPADVIRELIKSGIFATINQLIDRDTASLVAGELGYEVAEAVAVTSRRGRCRRRGQGRCRDQGGPLRGGRPGRPAAARPDRDRHGPRRPRQDQPARRASAPRTSPAGERGGITQHIGASEVTHDGQRDRLPRHARATRRSPPCAPAARRSPTSRSWSSPPTTASCPRRSRRSTTPGRPKVPIIVALNKIDKPDANPDRVKTELSEHGVVVEEYGGDVPLVPVCAKSRQGIDDLLEMVLLVADLAGPARPTRSGRAIGTDRRGAARQGPRPGRDRPHPDRHAQRRRHRRRRRDVRPRPGARERQGQARHQGRPARPRWSSSGSPTCPPAGDILRVVADEKDARTHGRAGSGARRAAGEGSGRATLEDLYRQIQAGQAKELRIILKADVPGFARAPSTTRSSSSTRTRSGSTSCARAPATSPTTTSCSPPPRTRSWSASTRSSTDTARRTAEAEGVDVRLYDIIYKLTDDIDAALKGLLEPELVEVVEGRAEVRQIFRVGKSTVIAGCVRHRRPHRARRRLASSAAARSWRPTGSSRCAASGTTSARWPPASSAASAWRTTTTSTRATSSSASPLRPLAGL